MRAGAGRTNLELPDTIFPIENFRYLHDDLACRVIILEQQESLVFVSLDLTSLKEYAIDAIKTEISSHYAVPLDHIFISVSHTFSAPHTRSIEAMERSSEEIKQKNQLFLQIILSAVADAVEKAIGTIQRVKVICHTAETNATINRDVEQEAGYWIGRNPNGFSDRKLPILKFMTENQEILAVLYSVDVQSSLVETIDDTAVSSDFIGLASKSIEDHFDCPALIMLGAAADQIPKSASQDFQDLTKQATALGNVLIEEIKQEGSETDGPFVLDKLTVTVKGQELPDRKQLKPARDHVFIPSADRRVSIPIVTFGEVAIVMLKPEITSNIGAGIKARSPYETTIVATMINGGQKYMADEESYQKCTYEAMNSMFASGSAEIVSEKVLAELIKRK
ncbi:alkaline ceramidase [Enterococcus hulanensis]|uniref:alkaline ceramidase n=1 Tax=Enterococcus hulanensis TaxID=2559929 RepID=UPI0010F464C8|nr:alkaline ceramidase [Enterococcus hulanensis]